MSSQKKLLLLVLLGVLAWWLWQDNGPKPPAEPQPLPAPAPVDPKPPEPKKPDPKKPRRPGPQPSPAPFPGPQPQPGPRPWDLSDEGSVGAPGKPTEGGTVSPDGTVQVVCDLPARERKKNIASKGLGCCVFRSIEYAGRYQNEKVLIDLPERMRDAGVPGGGYPEKVVDVLKQFAPDVGYGQDTSGDPEILEAVLRSGRMACITYDGHDCHYSGSIAHMVCCPYFDRQTGWACVSDNNFIGEDQFVWMSCDELVQRWKGNHGGWVFFLLSPPPPPVPYNDVVVAGN